MCSWFCDRLCLIFKPLAWRDMTDERAVMLLEKVAYFGEFGYLSSSCIRKSIIVIFLSSSKG